MIEYNKKSKEETQQNCYITSSKLNGIRTLISQALIDFFISPEEYQTIIWEKEKHERMKENIRMMKSGDEKDELSKNNKNIRKNSGNV